MFKLIFGFLGLMIALAVVSSLLKTQFVALGQLGQTKTRVLGPSGNEAELANGGAGSRDGRAVGKARLDGVAATSGAEMPTAQQQVQDVNKSVFERTDQAWQQSEQRYRRADP